MICADTSTWIAFLGGEKGRDAEALEQQLANLGVLMAPVVLSELLSDPKLSPQVETALLQLPCLEVRPGYWARAGRTRAGLIRRGYRPKLADTLIAQSCLDHRVALLTRDGDFEPFAQHAGLALA